MRSKSARLPLGTRSQRHLIEARDLALVQMADGMVVGRPETGLALRLRSWMAKCGVEAPTS